MVGPQKGGAGEPGSQQRVSCPQRRSGRLLTVGGPESHRMGRNTMHVTPLQPSRPCECSGSHCLYLPCAEQRNGQRKGRVAPQCIILKRDLDCQVPGCRRAMVDMTAGQAFGRPLARQGARLTLRPGAAGLPTVSPLPLVPPQKHLTYVSICAIIALHTGQDVELHRPGLRRAVAKTRERMCGLWVCRSRGPKRPGSLCPPIAWRRRFALRWDGGLGQYISAGGSVLLWCVSWEIGT